MFNQIILTNKQIDDFKSRGYLVIRRGLSDEDMKKIKLWIYGMVATIEVTTIFQRTPLGKVLRNH